MQKREQILQSYRSKWCYEIHYPTLTNLLIFPKDSGLWHQTLLLMWNGWGLGMRLTLSGVCATEMMEIQFTRLDLHCSSCNQGIGIEAIRQNHSIHIRSSEALIQFLYNSLCSRSHSNSIPYNWDSIHNNSRQLCHSMSILHNSTPFPKQLLIPEFHSLHILVVTT